jgi:hypothetical protein
VNYRVAVSALIERVQAPGAAGMMLAKFPLDVRHGTPLQNRETVLDAFFARAV